MRIAHIITRMIIGGAQENTLFTCQDLISDYSDQVLLITGPSLGPEGDLLRVQRGQQVPIKQIDSLRRRIHPLLDWQAYRGIKRVLRDFQPEVVHTHSAKGGSLVDSRRMQSEHRQLSIRCMVRLSIIIRAGQGGCFINGVSDVRQPGVTIS